MSEFENWSDWLKYQESKRVIKRKTILRDRTFSEEAWREVFGERMGRYAQMINQDYPEDAYARYVVPTTETGKRSAYIGISNNQDGRVFLVYRLEEGLDETGAKDFYPDYGYEYGYDIDIDYRNPASDEEKVLDMITVKKWEVDDDIAFQRLIGLKVAFSRYVRWEVVRPAFYSLDDELRLYEPMQGKAYVVSEPSKWIEFEKRVSAFTHQHFYKRNEDGEMILAFRNVNDLPQNLGKADVVSFR